MVRLRRCSLQRFACGSYALASHRNQDGLALLQASCCATDEAGLCGAAIQWGQLVTAEGKAAASSGHISLAQALDTAIR